jgi:hypothetical protein
MRVRKPFLKLRMRQKELVRIDNEGNGSNFALRLNIYLRKKLEEKMATLTKIVAISAGKRSLHWFSRKTPIFSTKIGENRQNIDPR